MASEIINTLKISKKYILTASHYNDKFYNYVLIQNLTNILQFIVILYIYLLNIQYYIGLVDG